MFKYSLAWRKTSRLFYSRLVLPLVALVATSCSSSDSSTPAQTTPENSPSFFSIMADTVSGSVRGAFHAVQTPLEDIGLKRQPIPEPLQKLTGNPYTVPPVASCKVVSEEVTALNELLGQDLVVEQVEGMDTDTSSLKGTWGKLQTVSWQERTHYLQQGSSFVQDRAAEEVLNRVTVFPYRNWVRWISGAESHSKKVAAAYEVGKIRRAFLRGIMVNLHCMETFVVEPILPVEIRNLAPIAVSETALADSGN